jgi:endonuclease/exonuclease/phosphatase (EEP) superfamily protein YafD
VAGSGQGLGRTVAERLRLAVIALAVAYPVALVLVIAAMRGIGERSSLVTLAMYLPRAGFALPLPLLVAALLFVRPRAWLLTQLCAALLVVFPIMGLRLAGARAPTPGAARLRVLSCNVDLASALNGRLAAVVHATDPDLVLLQETPEEEVGVLTPQLPGYFVRRDGQFVVASKHPILDVYFPPPLRQAGEDHDANFVRYRVRAPGGLVDVYDVHPVSPHASFDRLRGAGLLHELATGHFFVNQDAFRRLGMNAALRARQVRAVAEHAAASAYPVVIAGDTNLPSGSWALGETFAGFRDGFAEVGRGFGYTFPARHAPPWLRLDRVLADDHFRFVSFSRLDVHVSKHFPVLADLELTPQKQ